MKTPKLYILIGLPGSGKTTKMKEIIKEYALENNLSEEDAKNQFSWQSSDYYRGKLSFEKTGKWNEDDQSNSKLAFQTINENTKRDLSKGLSVIYDATNIVAENREELISNFKKQGIIFDAIPVFLNTPIEICKQRNQERYLKMQEEYEKLKDTEPKVPLPRIVPDDVIDKMAIMLSKPTLLEGYAVPSKTHFESRYETIIKIIKEKISAKNELDYIPTFNYIKEKLTKNPYINLSIYARCIRKRKLLPKQMDLMLDVVELRKEHATFLVKTKFNLSEMEYIKKILENTSSSEFGKIKSEFKKNEQNIDGFKKAAEKILGAEKIKKLNEIKEQKTEIYI